MTLGSTCHNSPSGQEGWCVVLDCCMLHLKLAAALSAAAHGHSLWVEDVNLQEAAGHQLLKSGLVPSLLHFSRFHQSSSFISLGDSYCSTIDMSYSNYSTDGIQWQCYLAINIKLNLLAILTRKQIPSRDTLDFPIILQHSPSAPRSLSKSSPVDDCLCLSLVVCLSSRQLSTRQALARAFASPTLGWGREMDKR